MEWLPFFLRNFLTSGTLQVRIALQLDDGSRLQASFCSGQTLWELLSHFAQTR
uniref:TUG ubiquitin-like domain-containing protein n=1 Tax=Piliocolobus tephrosceles TaxID=591936 RepID=A0A8C9GTX3_9PRIM